MNLEQMIARQQELLNTARAAGRELNAEETREYNELQGKIDALNTPQPTGGARGADNNPPADAEQIRAAERNRISGIRSLVTGMRSVNPNLNALSEESMTRYISENMSEDQVRAAITSEMINAGTPGTTRGTADVTVTADERDKFCRAAGDALAIRAGLSVENPAEGHRDLMGASLRDLAIKSLRDEGVTGIEFKTSDEIFRMASRQFLNPTAAFPAMLDNVIDKAVKDGYKTADTTFEQWTKKGTLKDFKTADNNYLMGPAPNFREIPEGGEVKASTINYEKLPTRKLKNHGEQFNLTMEAFVNDDIDLVVNFPKKYTAAARRTINQQCYEILCKNPAIYDGTNLFSEDHKNQYKTGTGITQKSLQSMMTALSTQKNQFGEAIIVRPATIVVPVGMAFEIYALLNSPTINTADNTQAVNPLYRYASQIKVVEDPTINALSGGFGKQMPWFLMGSKDDVDFIEVDYLNGQETPNFRRMEVAGQLGFVWDIWLPWGVSVMDYRGAIKNPGIVLADPLA